MTETPKLEPLDRKAVHEMLAAHELFRASRAEGSHEADLSYNIITGFDFSGKDLSGVHFQGAILEGCRFRKNYPP